MVKDKEKLDEEPEEEDNKELEDDSSEDDLEDAGIFDEELELSEDDSVSDFSIGNTILSSAPLVHGQHGRQGHNLEELAGRQKAEDSKWNESSEFDDEENTGKDFYSSSGGDFYGEKKNGDGLYNGENGNSDLYGVEKNELYSGENGSGKKVYDAGKSGARSYGQLVDNRRSGRSMLEVAGFEDKAKQKSRDIRGHVKYEGKAE